MFYDGGIRNLEYRELLGVAV